MLIELEEGIWFMSRSIGFGIEPLDTTYVFCNKENPNEAGAITRFVNARDMELSVALDLIRKKFSNLT